MFKDLFGWWSKQMFDLIPGPLRRRDTTGPNPLIIELGPEGSTTITCSRRHGGAERLLATLTLDATGIAALKTLVTRLRERRAMLRVPAEYMLERNVVLPLAAEMAPEEVLQNEIDRLTPFTAGEIYWSWRLLRRDRLRGRLHLRLTFAVKAMLRPKIISLLRAGVLPVLLDVVTPDGRRRILFFRRAKTRRVVILSVAAVYIAAVLAGIVLPFMHVWSDQAAVDAEISRLRPQMAEVNALRSRLALRDNNVFAKAEESSGNVLDILGKLTETIPLDTFLTDITVRQRKLTFSGQSADAARLIALLAADPRFRDPVFIGPVTRDPTGATERFSIETTYAPR